MKQLKITITIPCDKGFRNEEQIITEDSTSHELLRNYANENMYEIKSEPIQMTNDQLKNRLAHINSDIEIIEETIKRNVPILLNNESYRDTKVFAETFKQNITNIYTACDLTSDEVEKKWSTHESILPTYAEYTKNVSLSDKLKMYYDADLDQPISATNLCKEMADALSSPTWLDRFEKDFENYLKEREYIR
jgi:tRNA A22 N-methylase